MTKSTSTARVAQSAKAPSAKAKANAPVAQSKAPAAAPLSPIEVARSNVQAKVAEGVGVTLHTNGKAIKGLSAEPVVARPQRKKQMHRDQHQKGKDKDHRVAAGHQRG
jgi:hypothetical protein